MPEISILDVVEKWGVSRPTVLAALKSGKLVGRRDAKGKHLFEASAVVAWRGEPKDKTDSQKESLDLSKNNDLQDFLVKSLKEHILSLQQQLTVKDDQISRLQETLSSQTRLIEHQSKPGFFARIFSRKE